MSKIVITGAAGNFGKATIENLLNKGANPSSIVALVRDESKASNLKDKGVVVKIGDYDQYGSLVDAFQGAEKVFLISGTDLANRSKQHQNVVSAAKEAGAKHILYTSIERKFDDPNSPLGDLASSHFETEKAIKDSGLDYTIFRNNLYLEVIPMFVGEKVFETGIFLPAGEGKSAFASREDLAEAVANVLLSEGHENKEYAMNNTKNYSFGDVAETLSSISGKEVNYVSPSVEVYSDVLSKAGVPAVYIGMFVGFAEAIKQGQQEAPKTDLEELLGRKPTSLKDYLTQVYS